MKSAYTLLFLFVATLIPLSSKSQNLSTKSSTISVFLDCQACYRSYLRQHIPFINYVRDKEDADVHLLITRQRTGSGGLEYTLRFLGRQKFQKLDKTRTYISASTDTNDERRKGLTRIVKISLLSYLSQTEVLDQLSVTYQKAKKGQSPPNRDKWNYWVFEVQGDSYFSGEESQSSLFLSLGASADRVTPDWKIAMNYDYDFNRRTFTELDSLDNEQTSVYVTQGQRFDVTIVKSLSDHWSVGIFSEAYSSSKNNINYTFSGSPALEYNIYPYKEYSEHEISFMYLISTGYYNYDRITIYNERSQVLVRQQLRSRINFIQPWGEFEGRLNASAYMHDLSKNQLSVDFEVDIRIFRGLSVSFSGRYALINDQLFIPKGEISDAEQLLDLRQQSTAYSYGGSIGIEYSFGSIYNNVVNPRF